MTIETFLSLLGLALAAGWTPGPNNSLVANSGARFGFRATLPHIIGIGIGFPFMVFVIAIGLGVLFEQSLYLREGVRWIGVIVLLWFAYKIATASIDGSSGGHSKPFTFWQSAAFQWINPKAWAMATSFGAAFVEPGEGRMISLLWLTFGCFALSPFSSVMQEPSQRSRS
jgi:threonine/homoserine/homoserine lactone efflux protein